jgi:hypothetical protein
MSFSKKISASRKKFSCKICTVLRTNVRYLLQKEVYGKSLLARLTTLVNKGFGFPWAVIKNYLLSVIVLIRSYQGNYLVN